MMSQCPKCPVSRAPCQGCPQPRCAEHPEAVQALPSMANLGFPAGNRFPRGWERRCRFERLPPGGQSRAGAEEQGSSCGTRRAPGELSFPARARLPASARTETPGEGLGGVFRCSRRGPGPDVAVARGRCS